MSSEFDETTLRDIAEMTGGQYFRAKDKDALRRIYEEIDQLEKTKIRVREYSKRTETFTPFLVAALACLLLELLLRFFVLRTVTE
jgi:Ca-activated chloride channel family protein